MINNPKTSIDHKSGLYGFNDISNLQVTTHAENIARAKTINIARAKRITLNSVSKFELIIKFTLLNF